MSAIKMKQQRLREFSRKNRIFIFYASGKSLDETHLPKRSNPSTTRISLEPRSRRHEVHLFRTGDEVKETLIQYSDLKKATIIILTDRVPIQLTLQDSTSPISPAVSPASAKHCRSFIAFIQKALTCS